MLRTFDLQTQEFNPLEPWQGFLSASVFAIRTTYHTTARATPAELVFGRHMIFDRKLVPNWEKIRKQIQKIIKNKKDCENAKPKDNKYNVGEKVLYRRRYKKKQKHDRPYSNPFEIIKCYSD